MTVDSARLFAAFAQDWGRPTLDSRVASLAASLTAAGWSAVRVEIAAPGATARADIGLIPLHEAGAAGRVALVHALARFARDGAYVVPRDRRGDLGELLAPGREDVVVVPLIAQGDQIGTIVALTPVAAPDDVKALRAFADVLAIAVDADQRQRRAEGDAERAAVIARVGESIRASLDREEILRAVARDVRIAFGSDRCTIYVRDDRNPSVARGIAADDPRSSRPPLPERIPIAGTLLNRCLGLGQAVRIGSDANDVDRQQLIAFGAVAMLLVPFVVDGRVDAGIAIQFERDHRFDERDLLLMRTIAMHVSLALANSRLYERERSARRRAEDIERNVRALKDTRSVADILHSLLEIITQEFSLIGSGWAVERSDLVCRVVSNRSEGIATIDDRAPEALAVINAMADHELITIAARDDGAWVKIVGTRGGFALPLRVEHRLYGMLAFEGLPRDIDDSQGREAYVRTVAAHGALALANARAFEAERRFAAESAAISEAGRTVLAHNDLGALAEAMTRYALELSDANMASLYVPRDGVLARVACATIGGECALPQRISFEDPLVERAIESGNSMLATLAGGAVAVVPLRSAASPRAAGVFVCQRASDDARPFDRSVLRLLEALGTLVALGLRNVELYSALSENNEFKDDLLAMFTHDFKGPLTVIQGYTELLLEEETGERKASVETIYAQSKRLAKLADDSLVLARTQAAGFSLQRDICDLNGFVGESVHAHDPGEDRIEYVYPEEDDTIVFIDRTRLRHVLDNVIGNALKYSEGVVRVEVETRGSEAFVRVSDRGIGIPPADLERVFVRFGRGTNARSRGIAGTGVGLYISRKIVEVHGGRIAVRSVENEGSTFEIVLPLAPAAGMTEDLEPAGRPDLVEGLAP
jgi:signal transduction histidine kinase